MRILHTMLRVGDLERSIDVLHATSWACGSSARPTGPSRSTRWRSSATATSRRGAVIELTYNYGVGSYDLGTGFGHIAIEVPDAAAACAAVRAKGGTVTREAGPVKGGTTVIAFVQDPDGYKIELIERG